MQFEYCFSIIGLCIDIYGYGMQGRIQDFKLGGGALKKIAPSGGRCEHFWGISCEKSRFYPPKNHIFSNFRGDARRVRPPPESAPGML
jgi:hypothetical protein